MNKPKDGKEEEIKAVASAMRKKWRDVLAIFVQLGKMDWNVSVSTRK